MPQERSLRLFSLFCTAIATPLVIATTVVSIHVNNQEYWRRRPVTAFCFGYIPLALTVLVSVASLKHHRKHRLTGAATPANPHVVWLDLLAGIAYIGVLIPIWTVEIGALVKPGLGLLAGYTTAPMIVTMFIHFGFFLYNFKWLYASFTDRECRQCPTCRNKFAVSGPEVRTTVRSGQGYSLLRAENYLDADDDAVVYSDVRASADLRPEETSKGKEIEV